jgi:hypothetical protein
MSPFCITNKKQPASAGYFNESARGSELICYHITWHDVFGPKLEFME